VVRRSAVFREVGYGGSYAQHTPSSMSPAAAAPSAAAAANDSASASKFDAAASTGVAAAAAVDVPPAQSSRNEVATSFSDEALVDMLSQPPKQVPHLRTR
jgi:hypothetical protein